VNLNVLLATVWLSFVTKVLGGEWRVTGHGKRDRGGGRDYLWFSVPKNEHQRSIKRQLGVTLLRSNATARCPPPWALVLILSYGC